MVRVLAVLATVFFLAAGAVSSEAAAMRELARERTIGTIEAMAFFDGAMPTGVTVSQKGRIFVNFPQWGDKVTATVMELKRGKTVAFPDQKINTCEKGFEKDCFVSVQSVVVDPRDRLWVLDTGSIAFGPTTFGGPKLVGIDLTTNKVFKTILFPPEVALVNTYLNDIRFDLRKGTDGMAFITDSGAGAIIVVDLATGKAWRRLVNHPSTKAEKGFMAMVEGKPLLIYLPDQKPMPLAVNADGIAISSDGSRLFYCPLSSRRLYSVAVDVLADPTIADESVAAAVKDHGDKGGASDGLESDTEGRIYLTDYEHNAIHRYLPDGTIETIAHNPRMLWPDTLSLAGDGYLYFTANQIERGPAHNGGKDLRQKPYVLFRVNVGAQPVQLK